MLDLTVLANVGDIVGAVASVATLVIMITVR